VSRDDLHDNSRNDQSNMSNIMEDLDGLVLGHPSSEDVLPVSTLVFCCKMSPGSANYTIQDTPNQDSSCHMSGK